RQQSSGKIALAGKQRRDQALRRGGNDADVQAHVLSAGVVAIVELLLELEEQLVLRSALPAAVDPVLGSGRQNQGADHASLDDGSEIAGERLEELGLRVLLRS